MSERVFVDSAAFYALADPRDDNHARATATAQRYACDASDLYTTNFVIAEAHGLLLNRLDRDTALRTLDHIYAGSIRIVRPSATRLAPARSSTSARTGNIRSLAPSASR